MLTTVASVTDGKAFVAGFDVKGESLGRAGEEHWSGAARGNGGQRIKGNGEPPLLREDPSRTEEISS
jgi:hypothetical protein